jgi:hypothetical protein
MDEWLEESEVFADTAQTEAESMDLQDAIRSEEMRAGGCIQSEDVIADRLEKQLEMWEAIELGSLQPVRVAACWHEDYPCCGCNDVAYL